MTVFEGFTANESFTRIPDSLFRLLGEINDLNELKVTLYVLWRIEHIEGAFRQICRSEIVEDEDFMKGISSDDLDRGLEKAVERGTLLMVKNAEGGFYFLNSPLGRTAAQAMQNRDWRAAARSSHPPRETSNIYKLYEENIGPITPMIADMLNDAEKAYPDGWIADAMEQSLKSNVRNWKYIDAILRRWKEEGRAEKQNRPNTEETRGDVVTRKVEEFLKPKH